MQREVALYPPAGNSGALLVASTRITLVGFPLPGAAGAR